MNKNELIKFYEDELLAVRIDLEKQKRKFPDWRKVKKNDMNYGSLIAKDNLIEDFIQMIKELK